MSATLPEIRCEARDRTTCKYHGAILRAEAAVAAKDWSGWAAAQADIARAATETPEVLAFFLTHAMPAPTTKVLAPKLAMGMWDQPRKEIHLDGLVAQAKLRQHFIDRHGLLANKAQQTVDAAVAWVSKMTPQQTVFDRIREMLGPNPPAHYLRNLYGEHTDLEARTRVAALWQDTAYLQRLDLREQTPEAGFQGRLNQQLAHLLGEHGNVLRPANNGWGWKNDMYARHRDGLMSYQQFFTVLSVLNVREDEWDQNDNTGEWSSHQGFQGECLLDDNTVRILRYEGDLGTIVRMLERQ